MAASELSDSYLVLDFDTSGLNNDDLIVGASCIVVRQGQAIAEECLLLDWTRRGDDISTEWLAKRLACVPCQRVTIDDLRQNGSDPVTVLSGIGALIRDLPPEADLVGHNIIGFDLPFLKKHLKEWLDDSGDWLDTVRVWDTGLAAKAAVAQVFPEPDESWREFLVRVAEMNVAGLLWSLDHCVRQHPELSKKLATLGKRHPLYTVRAARELYEIQRRAAAKQGQTVKSPPE